jgi:tetratricopeptide (TPR) repeat protein
VIARGSSTPYRKTRKTPSQIAQELGVGYILTATVRWEKSGGSGRVHVTPEFVEVKKAGAPTAKWQHGFDAALTDVFAVQSVIASRVAEALGVALGAGEEKRLSEKPTQNLAASNAYLKGEEIWNGMGDDAPSIRKALALYDQAVALDPAFLQAWARVSWASSILYANSTPTPELAERARSAAEKAIALAPNRPEGYLAFGHYERLVSKDFNRALEQYAKGQRVAPGNADLLYGTARAEEGLGRWDSAVERLRKAASFDPRSVVNLTALGYALQRLRRYPEAREFYERGLALAPANLSLIGETAMTFLGEGNLAGARAVLNAVPKDVGSTELVAYVATANDLVWFSTNSSESFSCGSRRARLTTTGAHGPAA